MQRSGDPATASTGPGYEQDGGNGSMMAGACGGLGHGATRGAGKQVSCPPLSQASHQAVSPGPYERSEACLMSERHGLSAQCGHGGRAEASSDARPMLASAGAQSKQPLASSWTYCRSGFPAVAGACLPRGRRCERSGNRRPARVRRMGTAHATFVGGPMTGRAHVGDCGGANAGQPGSVAAAPRRRGGEGAAPLAPRPAQTSTRGYARRYGGMACTMVSGGTSAWWRRCVVMRKQQGRTG